MSERKTHKLFRFIKPFLHVRYFGLLATSDINRVMGGLLAISL